MLSLRGVAPLLLTGTSGVALLAFGIGGLSGMDPQLQRAAETVRQERPAPDRSTPDRSTPEVTVHRVDCPWEQDRGRRPGDV